MAMIPPISSVGAVVVDASFLIAICSKETNTEITAIAEFDRCSQLAYKFFAPGVLFAEVLYVLCGKLANGTLSAADHIQAVIDLEQLAEGILPPPYSEASLIQRAEAIRGGYSCRRSADGIYIALAEQLAKTQLTILLTFDKDLAKQAARHAPSVIVKIL